MIKMKLKKKVKWELRLLLTTIVLLLLYASTITVYNIYQNYKNQIESTITYNENVSITPSICLTNNQFLTSECSTEAKSYVTSLINNINLLFNYNISSSDFANYTYSYKIVAHTVANEKGDSDKIVYETNDTLDSGTFNNSNVNYFNVDKTINFDFQKYNNTIAEFKRNYVLALDSKVEILATVSAVAKYDDRDSVELNKTLVLSIPLTDQTVNIDRTLSNYTHSDTDVHYIDSSNYHNLGVALSILMETDFIVTVLVVLLLVHLIPKENAYKKRINKILKEYDRAIVKVKHSPSLKGLNIITIESFEELLDAKDNLDKPILFYENKPRGYSAFIIIAENEAYIYSLTVYDEKEKRMKKEI